MSKKTRGKNSQTSAAQMAADAARPTANPSAAKSSVSPLYYCPLSGRGAASEAALSGWLAADVPARILSERTQQATIGLRKDGFLNGKYVPDASDGYFACFEQANDYVLISHSTIPDSNVTEANVLLERARASRPISGIHSAELRPEGIGRHRIIVTTKTAPGAPWTNEKAPARGWYRAAKKQLSAAHRKGQLHGGLSDRWVDPSNPARPISGFGLAPLYGLLRRQQLNTLGLLDGDPRYAAPDVLETGCASRRTDRIELSRVRSVVDPPGDEESSLPNLAVQGPTAMRERARVQWPGEWTPLLSRPMVRVGFAFAALLCLALGLGLYHESTHQPLGPLATAEPAPAPRKPPTPAKPITASNLAELSRELVTQFKDSTSQLEKTLRTELRSQPKGPPAQKMTIEIPLDDPKLPLGAGQVAALGQALGSGWRLEQCRFDGDNTEAQAKEFARLFGLSSDNCAKKAAPPMMRLTRQ